MIKILNGLFSILKLILSVAAFCLTLYIMIGMYKRLDKNIMEAVDVFIPFILLFVLFVINLVARQSGVNKNIFYNLTSCIALTTILVVGLRSILDTNMIYHEKLGYNINFVFFNDFIAFMKIILYGLCIANVFLMFQPKEKNKVKRVHEIEVL